MYILTYNASSTIAMSVLVTNKNGRGQKNLHSGLQNCNKFSAFTYKHIKVAYICKGLQMALLREGNLTYFSEKVKDVARKQNLFSQ
jgi:hypothetical protein